MEVACKAFHQERFDEEAEDADDDLDGDEDNGVSPKDVGHNIYILIHQLALYNKEIGEMLQTDPTEPIDPKVAEALNYYRSHTAQIEVVRQDHNLEQIVFPIPEICEYLTEITKFEVREHSEVDEQGSKLTDFFAKTEEMYEEMKWQKKLRSSPALYWVSKQALTWSKITFICSVFINVILAGYYPYRYELPSKFMNQFRIY